MVLLIFILDKIFINILKQNIRKSAENILNLFKFFEVMTQSIVLVSFANSYWTFTLKLLNPSPKRKYILNTNYLETEIRNFLNNF